MVLNSPEPKTPPVRGKTLPNPLLMRQSQVDLSRVQRVQKAHTLPGSNRSFSTSNIDLNNAINNNPDLNHFGSSNNRVTQSVSILSLHQSDDNEAYCFDNRYDIGSLFD